MLPKEYADLGDLVGIDGSLIDAYLSMYWADYREGSKMAQVHIGFDLNRGIPRKVFLSDGNGAERPFVCMILSSGQTGVTDPGYQAHDRFDQWQEEKKHFVCRIKASTKKAILKTHEIDHDSNIFYDAVVLLGTPGVNQTQKPVRVVGYTVNSVKYWVATSRHDLTAEQIALIAAAARISDLMDTFEKGSLQRFTPCLFKTQPEAVHALAVVHTELVLIHPFREGNGLLARILAILMAVLAGLPPLDFGHLAGRKRQT